MTIIGHVRILNIAFGSLDGKIHVALSIETPVRFPDSDIHQIKLRDRSPMCELLYTRCHVCLADITRITCAIFKFYYYYYYYLERSRPSEKESSSHLGLKDLL